MNCPLCNGHLNPSVKGMLKCEDCGLFRQRHVPEVDELKKRGRAFMLSACMDNDKRAGRMKNADEDLDELERYASPGKLFDVGAAAGFAMKAAMDRGWEVRGNEISELAIEWAKKNYNISIEHGVLEEVELTDEEFDVVTFWNTLEHLRDPAVALRIAKRALKVGGYIYLKVPTKNDDGVARSYEELHVTEFNTHNLSDFLSLIGFEVVIQEFYDRGAFLAMVLLGRRIY